MKRVKTDSIIKTILFAFPSYWTLALLFIVLILWKTPINDPDVIAVELLTVAIIIAAILLSCNCYWIVMPMIALGVYIALQDDQHIGTVLTYYGIYLSLHYTVCGMYIYKRRNKKE